MNGPSEMYRFYYTVLHLCIIISSAVTNVQYFWQKKMHSNFCWLFYRIKNYIQLIFEKGNFYYFPNNFLSTHKSYHIVKNRMYKLWFSNVTQACNQIILNVSINIIIYDLKFFYEFTCTMIYIAYGMPTIFKVVKYNKQMRVK